MRQDADARRRASLPGKCRRAASRLANVMKNCDRRADARAPSGRHGGRNRGAAPALASASDAGVSATERRPARARSGGRRNRCRGGTRAESARVGAIAATGSANVQVFARPTVAILSTGNEIAEPGQPLAPGQITRHQPLHARMAIVRRPAAAVPLPIAADSVEELSAALTARADIVRVLRRQFGRRARFDSRRAAAPRAPLLSMASL